MKEFGKTGINLPEVGFGTWKIGGGYWSPDYRNHEALVNLVKKAVEMGLSIVDTAEMYGGGHAEEIVGEAVRDMREKAFIVTKLWPNNAGYDSTLKHAELSLKRLRIDYVDLYLLHAPPVMKSLRDTMKAFEKLVLDGKARFVGVSNFSVKKIEEARSYLSKVDISAVQNEYSLIWRDDEGSVIPYCEKERIAYMAYSPLGAGSLFKDSRFSEIEALSKKYGKSPVAVSLNWVIRKGPVFAIPKTSKAERLIHFVEAMGWTMEKEDYDRLGSIFSSKGHNLFSKLFHTLRHII